MSFCAEPSDASVPKPSLRSTSSLASLNTTSSANGTSGTQKNADDANSDVRVQTAEDEVGDDESAFDEEGILFGDSELIDAVPLQLLIFFPV